MLMKKLCLDIVKEFHVRIYKKNVSYYYFVHIYGLILITFVLKLLDLTFLSSSSIISSEIMTKTALEINKENCNCLTMKNP